jgi:putative thioredoxin
MSAASPHVVDVTDATFGAAVLQESYRRPVVVDFWADWCQPCKLIGPVLERLANEHNGQFMLAKLDVDANPQISASFGIQSIPAVKGFVSGRLANQFIGAVSEPTIHQFLRTLLPSEADRLTAQALQAEEAGRTKEAEGLFLKALGEDDNHLEAALGMGRLAALRGDVDEARRRLEPLRPDPEAERLLAALEVSEWAGSANSKGPLARAERAAAEGRFEEALEAFLSEVEAGGDHRDTAREAMLKVFAVLGETDPLTRDYRRKLAAALF